jgi:hypothetical protein
MTGEPGRTKGEDALDEHAWVYRSPHDPVGAAKTLGEREHQVGGRALRDGDDRACTDARKVRKEPGEKRKPTIAEEEDK